MRNYRGYDYNSGYPTTELSLDQFKHIFTPSLLKQLSGSHLDTDRPTTGVNFNGNLGDFALAKDGAEIVEYLVEHGVTLSINTNGSLRSPDWWSRLALPGVQIGFALDGLADTHSLYRQDTDWNRVIENAQAYINAGGQAIWRFIPFDHNQHQEIECRTLAKKMGFCNFENIYDGRDTGPVFTRAGEYSHYLGKNDNPDNLPQVKNLLEGHVQWFAISKDSIPQDKPNIEYFCRHLKNREIYIAADGSVYPCCFTGFYPTQMHHAGNTQLKDIVQENNALQYDLAHCMAWFDRVDETWGKPSIAQGRLYTCVTSCGSVPS
jgi:sulfatase maturation enzyme AslB (radical SAM superfamily)